MSEKKYQIKYKNYVLCVDNKWRHAGYAENPTSFSQKETLNILATHMMLYGRRLETTPLI